MNKNSLNYNENIVLDIYNNSQLELQEVLNINKWKFNILKQNTFIKFIKFSKSAFIFAISSTDDKIISIFDVTDDHIYSIEATFINDINKCNDILYIIPSKELSSFNKSILLGNHNPVLEVLLKRSQELIPQIIKATPNISNRLAVVKSIKLSLELDNYSKDLKTLLEKI